MTTDSLSIPHIEDLSCNHISVKSACTGDVQFATIPPGADIYIFEESIGDYVLQSIKTGSMGFPSIISGIECTSPTRSNKFKLRLHGYVDVEGVLTVESGTTYPLDIIMEPVATSELGGGLLIPALAIGALILIALGRKKKKYKRKYEDGNEYFEEYSE